MSFSQFSMPGEIPWAKYGVDLVIECSGNNLTPEALEGHSATRCEESACFFSD